MASPKEPTSWSKHNIYKTRSKVAVDKDQVSIRGLSSDKVPKVTLARRSHIAIVDVIVTLKCIHLYFLSIVTRCSFWDVL